MVNDSTYLLVAVLALAAGLIGVGFKTFLYWLEDFVDELWEGRPEWARPAVGGVALGVVLLALPQMYGVGYPVMGKVLAGQYALWFIAILMFGKILASSLTLSIGGSGGVFAPSLFIGAMAGMAFGTLVHNVFGPAVGPPALYAVVAMGGVFAAAAQAPLTAIASVAEMTGNFRLTLPIMLACGIAAAVSKQLTYGSIYTTKLLRRGIDIERPRTTSVLQTLTVGDVMQPVPHLNGDTVLLGPDETSTEEEVAVDSPWERLVGHVTDTRRPQELFPDETLEQALRQLVLYGPDGLPVLSHDGRHLRGWITHHDVVRALAAGVSSSTGEIERGPSPPSLAWMTQNRAPTDRALRLRATRSSRSRSALSQPPPAIASARSPGHLPRESLRSPKDARRYRPSATRSFGPASESSFSRQPPGRGQ